MDRFLIKYEVRSIQKYIYRTSKIKEIVGASFAIRQCLVSTLRKACDHFALKGDFSVEGDFAFKDDFDFQIAYEGGGNLVCFLKGDEDLLHRFNRRVGYILLKDTYSLGVCYAYAKVSNDFDADRNAMENHSRDVWNQMSMPKLSSALPITMASSNSGQPLSRKDDAGRKITYESAYKLRQNEIRAKGDGRADTKFLDEMVDKGNDSYLGVIHIDANDLGVAIKAFFDKNTSQNATYEERVSLSRKVSRGIEEGYNKAFDSYLESFMGKLEEKDRKYRVIVNAGDDITLITNNMIAIPLVAGFLEEINKHSFFNDETRISACAGIAFVKSHFPYDKAYEMAEELCESAKKKAKSEEERKKNNGQSRCAFDYHICQSGMLGSVEEEEEKLSSLSSKPYFVSRGEGKSDDYETLLSALSDLRDKSNGMSVGKAKQLRNAYEKSGHQAEMAFRSISSRLKHPLDAFIGSGKAKYYDASTLVDFIKEDK